MLFRRKLPHRLLYNRNSMNNAREASCRMQACLPNAILWNFLRNPVTDPMRSQWNRKSPRQGIARIYH